MIVSAGVDARRVRAIALNRRAVFSTFSFLLLLLSTTVVVAASFLFAIDWARPILVAGYEFFPIFSADPDRIAAWLPDFAARFDALRGNSAGSPVTWASLLAIAALLFFVDYSRFPRRGAESLLGNPVAAPLVRTILKRFGYFQDIRLLPHGDIIASRRVIYVAKARVSRIASGKPSDVQQETLRFFMAHEFVHAIFGDNLAHSLFRLVLFWVSAIVVVYMAPSIVAATMVIVPFANNPALYFVFCLALSAISLGCLAISIYGVTLSYIKAREFHADAAAYALVGGSGDAYGDDAEHPRPAPGSAWSRQLSRFERAAHRDGKSLHARNLIPGALVLHAGLRSVYMMVAPAGFSTFVLGYDAACAVALTLALWSLPPRAGTPVVRPILPWLVAAIGLLMLTFATSGLLGYMVAYMGLPMLDDRFRYLLSWPLLAETGVSLVAVIALALRRIFVKPGGPATPSSLFRPAFLGLLAFPGLALSAVMLTVLLMFGSGLLAGTFGLIADMSEDLENVLVAAGTSAAFLAAAALVYLNLRSLTGWIFALEALLTAAAVFALNTCLAAALPAVNRTSSSISADTAEKAFARVIQQLTVTDWLAGAIFGAVVAVLYLLLRWLEFWARNSARRPRERR